MPGKRAASIGVMKNLLLLSNSRMPTTAYLEHAVAAIRETIAGAKKVVLILYASVTLDWALTEINVCDALASLGRFKTATVNWKATVIILHDARDVGKLPVWPVVAR